MIGSGGGVRIEVSLMLGSGGGVRIEVSLMIGSGGGVRIEVSLTIGSGDGVRIEVSLIIIPPLPKGGGGYTVLPLSVLPSVQDIFRHTFLSNF